MKLFKTSDIALIDRYTIENEPISDIDLMERASKGVANYILNETNYKGKIIILIGPGNNGGDGLALARLLHEASSNLYISVYLCVNSLKLNKTSNINLERLQAIEKIAIKTITTETDIPVFNNFNLIIDALFGSGLNRSLDGLMLTIVKAINKSRTEVLSIDIPSGLFGEGNTKNNHDNIVKATQTVTFQFPKISFLMPENERYVGNWTVIDIQLHPDAIARYKSKMNFLLDSDIKPLLKRRNKFTHKGTFGNALIIAGSYGKMGAALLASKACLRAGVGLLTTHIPHSGYQIIQTAIPEAMTSIDDSDLMFTSISKLATYNSIGIGPGLGTKPNTAKGFKKLLQSTSHPLVIDADALNILSENPILFEDLPNQSILTPHPKEFERLAGKTINAYERLTKAQKFASRNNVIIVLKGAHTSIIHPDGETWFNSTGNPGMATAGSGDVLTGILVAQLAQGYKPFEAAKIGVFIHGLAGDIAAARRGHEALIASDIIENLGEAFKLAHK